MHKMMLPSLLVCACALQACVASIAASAIGAAVRSANAQQQASRAPLDPQAAADACSSHASHHGSVRIIDVENRSSSKIIVWGTVGTEQERRSFECSYSGKVSDFKLRPIPAR